MAMTFDDYRPYSQFIATQQFSLCIETALGLLELTKELAGPNFQASHKGTPYYMMGVAAFASHDYSAASLYFDAALEQDLENHPGRYDLPAVRFMQLDAPSDDEQLRPLAWEFIAQVEQDLEVLARDYNGRPKATVLTVNDIKRIFLKPIIESGQRHRRALATTLISFVAEWRHRRRLIATIEHGSRDVFFLHMLRGCVLFESLLKEQTKKVLTKNTLGSILRNDLRAELELVDPQVGETEFNNIIAGLQPNMEMEHTINSVCRARNTLGHNLVWSTADLNAKTYDMLVKNIAAARLHVISRLYR